MKKVLALIACISTMGVMVAACGGESTAEAKDSFCTSLSDFSSAYVSYEGLNPATATNDEYDDAYDELDQSWDRLVQDAEDFAEADDNELTAAVDDLYDAAVALPGDNTARQNIEALSDEIQALPSAYKATFDGSGCATA
jgi:hypothetical protein